MLRIRTLIDKEWAEVFKNKLVLMTVLLLPLVFTVIPLVQLAATRQVDPSEMSDAPANVRLVCQRAGLSDAECMQGYLAQSLMMLFFLMPLAIPVSIASYSIVGEKTTRSLEPLLATPTRTTEIILGKGLAAVLPALAATWLSFTLYAVGARFFVVSDQVYQIIVNPIWLVGMLLVVPLLTLLSVSVAVFISSRVNDPRAAEQLSTLVMLPVLALFFLQILGLFSLNAAAMAALAGILLVADAAMITLAVKLFQRETILTRWH